MFEGKVFSIDLDYTLGDFSDVEPSFAISREQVKVPQTAPSLRPDLKDVLLHLRTDGARIAVSSGRSLPSLSAALELGGISGYVDSTFGREALKYTPHSGKYYAAVAEHFGLGLAEAPHNMLIIGDDELVDAPNDLSSVVLLLQEDGYAHSASLWLDVASALLTAGKGSFANGFEALFNKAELARQSPLRIGGVVKEYELNGTATLYLHVLSLFENSVHTPTVITPTVRLFPPYSTKP